MKTRTANREGILNAVRNAIRVRSEEQPADAEYIRTGALSLDARIDQFTSRLEDYDAHVFRCQPAGIAETVERAMSDRGVSSLLIPPALPSSWLPGRYRFDSDSGLDYNSIERAEGALTACTAAISFTGTIILTHSPSEGRRALTLIPDYHLCVVFGSQLFETVPEAIRSLRARRTSPITTISGPSATADIEMTRIKGVHGPRTLDVILVNSTVIN